MTISQDTSTALISRVDQDGVATLTLNRPQARNALSLALMAALQDQLTTVDRDPAIGVVVLAAAGPAFCAGHDLKELRAITDHDGVLAVFEACARLMLTITGLRQPVIAKVQGIATAAGCQLVATCDLAYAAQEARFATPGVNIGLFCSTPMVALSRAIGSKAAMEMLLTGEMIGAEEARRIGLINKALPKDQLDEAVDGVARLIAAKSHRTLAIGKSAFARQREKPLAEAYADTARVMAANMMEADAAEGIDAFLEKRPPIWCGRS